MRCTNLSAVTDSPSAASADDPAAGSVVAGRCAQVPGWSRIRFLLILLVISAVTVVFLTVVQEKVQGITAAIVLPLFSVAVAWLTGPIDRARSVRLTADTLEIRRWTRIRTTLDRAELAGMRVLDDPAVLELTPHDPRVFFAAHPELDEVRRSTSAQVPLGRRGGVAAVRELLAPDAATDHR